MKDKLNYNPYGTPDERKIAKMLDGLDNWAMNYDGNMRESVNEATFVPVSGTKAGGVLYLDNKKYQLKKDIKDVQIGNNYIVTLPKGTIIYNLPGGVDP